MKTADMLAWWQARPLREKLLLTLAPAAALAAVFDLLITAPMEKQLRRHSGDVQAMTAKLQSLRAAGADPQTARALQLQEAALRQRLVDAQARSQQLRQQLAEANRLPETLRAITATVGSARLLELDLSGEGMSASSPLNSTASAALAQASPTVATSPSGHQGLTGVVATSTPNTTGTTGTNQAALTTALAAGAGPGRVHRLPITLKVSGSYAELQLLLTQVERHAQALQWTSLTLDSAEWPAIQLTLKAHVLSLEPRWGAAS